MYNDSIYLAFTEPQLIAIWASKDKKYTLYSASCCFSHLLQQAGWTQQGEKYIQYVKHKTTIPGRQWHDLQCN